MTYLSDAEILNLLRANLMKIEPFERNLIKPLYVELRLGNKFTTIISTGQSSIDPSDPKFKIFEEASLTSKHKYTTIDIADDSTYAIAPGEFVLAVTKEKLSMPSNYLGILNARASLGRLGLQIFCSGGFVDPNFSGSIILEMLNVNRVPIILKPGMPIVKLSFEPLKKSVANQPGLGAFVDSELK